MDNPTYKQLALVREWLEEYRERDVDDVISNYERAKGLEEEMKDYYRNRRLHEQKAAEESALLCLETILHKKLFNAECLWRANELELPLKSTWSFNKYGYNLFEATFLEPITQEELDVFIEYYLSDEYESLDTGVAQHYEKLIAYALGQEYDSPFGSFEHLLNPNPHYPHWYAWYDRHFGTGDLVTLPDPRMEAEQVLLSAYRKKKNVDMSDFIEGFKNMDTTKVLLAYHPDFLAFAEHIKDYRMCTFFKTQTEHIHEKNTEEGQWWINYLEDMLYQEIPISAADDWRDAVSEAGFRHLQQNTIKLLPEYYDQYLHDPDFRSRHFDEKKWKSDVASEDSWEEMLIEGRDYLEQLRKDNPGD